MEEISFRKRIWSYLKKGTAFDPSRASPIASGAVKPPAGEKMTRGGFLGLGYFAFFSWLAGSAAAALRFLLPNVLYEPSQAFKAGHPEEYGEGLSERFKKDQRVWIIRQERKIYAVWARCTHLGCTPNWFQGESRFRCPCHGSNFTIDGDVIAGPAPRPLFRCAISLTPDGQLLVDKGRLEGQPGRREQKDFYVEV